MVRNETIWGTPALWHNKASVAFWVPSARRACCAARARLHWGGRRGRHAREPWAPAFCTFSTYISRRGTSREGYVCMARAAARLRPEGYVCMSSRAQSGSRSALRHRRREPQSRLRHVMADAAGRPPALGSRHGPSPRVRGHGSGGLRSGRMLAGGMYVSSWPVERLVHLGDVSMAEPASAACAPRRHRYMAKKHETQGPSQGFGYSGWQ